MKRKATHEEEAPANKRNKPSIIHIVDDESEEDYDESEALQRAIQMSLKHDEDYTKIISPKLKYTGEHMYLNKLPGYEKESYTHTLSIQDLLDVDNLESATLSTYCLDLEYLKKVLPFHKRCIPITLIKHWSKGAGDDDEKQGRTMTQIGKSPFCICHPYLLAAYSNMHAKLMLLTFPGFLRIVVSSANLTNFDWDCYTQTIWVQDFPIKMSNSSSNNSIQTQFEKTLLDFWSHLTLKLPAAWLCKYDYSDAKVDLVPSVPGYHSNRQIECYGHMLLRGLIKDRLNTEEHDALKQNNVYIQVSSMGSMNTKWLSEFATSLGVKYVPEATAQIPTKMNKKTRSNVKTETNVTNNLNQLKIIFPTIQTVANSELGMRAGGMIHLNQKTLIGKEFPRHALCDYENALNSQGRYLAHSKIMIHRTISHGHIGWMYIGSHNFSMAAWGRLQKNATQLQISNYEIGVFFKNLPPNVRIPFKIPPRSYNKSDEPFVLDVVAQE